MQPITMICIIITRRDNNRCNPLFFLIRNRPGLSLIGTVSQPRTTILQHRCFMSAFLCAFITLTRERNFFSNACSGQRQFSTVSFSGFGLWVRVRVLGSANHNRFPNSNPNLNHNSNRNLTLTPILTPNSS